MSAYEVRPVEGQAVEGCQYGYEMVGERWTFGATTGGTGECWNISLDDEGMHICDLDAFIAALIALRDSDANREHIARWSS